MTIYRKKPVEIEAIQWDGTAEGATPIIDWILQNGGTARYHGNTPADPNCPTPEYHATHVYCPSCPFALGSKTLHIDTLEGTMIASPQDFIIRGVRGEFYPCKPDIFAATYDEVVPLPEEPESYESYEVFVDSGPAHDRFKAFAETLGGAIELNWRDTEEI